MRSLFIIFSFTVFLISCKKNEETSPAPANNTPTTVSHNGNIQSGYYDLEYNGIITHDSMVVVSFFSTPAGSTAPTCIYGGTVTANGSALQFDTPQNLYTNNSTSGVNMQQITFSATGAGTVSAFSYSYTPVYPKCSGPIVLADTCVKANGITISLSGISNVNTNVNVSIYQGATNVTKYMTAPGGTVSFSAADLNNFTVNSPITLHLSFFNLLSDANVGSVVYGVTSNYTYQKLSYLK